MTTENDAPPPSSSPPTTREPAGATGGLDPYPPNPGARALMLAPHAVLVAELALVAALSRGSTMLLTLPALLVLSAWAAWLLARVDARHRPIAFGFGAWAALALLGRGLDVTVLATPGPYAGWARVAFHIEEAARLATTALPAWMAVLVLWRSPKGIALATTMTLFFGAAMPAIANNYPELRGDALRRVYLGAELAALFVAVVAIVAWIRRRGWNAMSYTKGMADAIPSAEMGNVWPLVDAVLAAKPPRWFTYGTVLALVVGDLVLLGVGAWRYGLFDAAYVVQQAGLLGVWGVVALLHGAALVMTRRRA